MAFRDGNDDAMYKLGPEREGRFSPRQTTTLGKPDGVQPSYYSSLMVNDSSSREISLKKRCIGPLPADRIANVDDVGTKPSASFMSN